MTIQNNTGSTITNATIESSIEQGFTNRQARESLKPTCFVNGQPNVSGTIPPGTCTASSYIFANDTTDNPGTGTFSSGSATALLVIKQSGNTIHRYTLPISLTLPPPTIKPTVRVLAPNEWETLATGSTYPIQWQWWSGTAQNFTVILSDSVGNSEVIASNIPANGTRSMSYAWNVSPYMPSGQYTIDVCGQFTSGDYICDKSDVPFSIQTPFIKVTNPQANATLTQNQPYTITWDAAGIASEITLKLMKNNQIFQTIGTAGSLQRTYSWTPTSAVGTGTNIFRVYIGGTTAGGQIKTNLGSTFSIVAPTAQNANASLLAALVVSVDELLNAISQLLSQLGQ